MVLKYKESLKMKRNEQTPIHLYIRRLTLNPGQEELTMPLFQAALLAVQISNLSKKLLRLARLLPGTS
jgi:hypothetical protein